MKIRCGNTDCAHEFSIENETVQLETNTVACPKCGQRNRIPKPKPRPVMHDAPHAAAAEATPPPNDSAVMEYGWIIVHDETMPQRVYTLKRGKNIIGRNSETTPPEVNLRIDTEDKYMSRKHCIIDVADENGQIVYILNDSLSTNGTFLNGKAQRLSAQDEIYLKDADCVQIGRTKVILKSARVAGSRKKAVESVTQMAYTKTIIQN
jgi:hypothetical protein